MKKHVRTVKMNESEIEILEMYLFAFWANSPTKSAEIQGSSRRPINWKFISTYYFFCKYKLI
jgi:hypothetical protein